jgi:hypothetical protein
MTKAEKRKLKNKDQGIVKIFLQGDALYTTEPMMKLCREHNWEYIFTHKDTRQKIKRSLHAHEPLDEFKAYMDKRIPALMKLYKIPGCNIALVKDNEVVWTESFGHADMVILRLVSTFYQQKRTGFRLLRVSAASILLGILIWCACQEYLFITSVFPVLSVWLGGAVFVFSIALLLSVVLPQWPRKYEE